MCVCVRATSHECSGAARGRLGQYQTQPGMAVFGRHVLMMFENACLSLPWQPGPTIFQPQHDPYTYPNRPGQMPYNV